MLPDDGSPEAPKPGSLCALTQCKVAHHHPVTGAEPDYHYVVKGRWEPRWKNPLKKSKDQRMWWFTVPEVAAKLGVKPTTVRKWIHDGKLVASQAAFASGSHFFIRGSDLDEWMRNQTRYV